MGDARTKAGVGFKETIHAVLIARQDYGQVVALVLHHLQENLDRLLPIVLLILGTMQVVGLIYKEYAAHRALQYVLGFGRGMSDVLAYQVIPRDGHEMAFANEAQSMEYARHPQGDCRLAGARISRERHVQRRRSGGEAKLLACTRHQ